jgi:hypothetical protein
MLRVEDDLSDLEDADKAGEFIDDRLQEYGGRQDYIRSMTRVSHYQPRYADNSGLINQDSLMETDEYIETNGGERNEGQGPYADADPSQEEKRDPEEDYFRLSVLSLKM